MEFIVCGGEKWCRNAIFLSFGILHNFSILTITNSTFDSQHSVALWFHRKLIGTSSEADRNLVESLSILPHDFVDTSSLQDYVFICQNFCSFAKKAVSLHVIWSKQSL